MSSSVQVISQQAIESMGAQTLKDIFDNTPGLTLQYGTFPAASAASKSSVSLRGLGATGTLWLIDGRRLAGEVKNPYDMERIPASSIARIEIVKGPMSALYGADALGGVINIITKQPQSGEWRGEVSLSHGSNTHGEADSDNVSAHLRGGKGKIRYSLNVSRLQTDPYSEREYTNTRIGRGQNPIAAIPTTPGFLNPNHPITKGNPFYLQADGTVKPKPLDPSRVTTDRAAVQASFDQFREQVQANVQENYPVDVTYRETSMLKYFADFGYPNEVASSASGMNANVKIKAFESTATWYSPDEKHLVTAGAEWRDEDREATVFTQTSKLSARGVNSKAVYAQDEWQITPSLRLTIGGRYDRYTQDAYVDANGQHRAEQNNSKTTARIGINQALGKGLNLRASAGQGYRVPDIRELYIQKQTPTGVQLGAYTTDPARGKTPYDLKPESTNAYELGLGGQNGKLKYDFAVFFNDITNRIEQIREGTGQTSYFTFKNISEATTKGLEARLEYAFNADWHGKLSWYELDTENKETAKPLEYTPERTLNAKLDWQATPRLNLGLSAEYLGKQFYTEQGHGHYTDSQAMLHFNTQYALDQQGRWEVFGGVRNITDESVEKRLGSDPGRMVHMGVRGSF